MSSYVNAAIHPAQVTAQTEGLTPQSSLVCLSDTHCRCSFANRAWSELTGRTATQAMGDGWLRPIHLLDIQRFLRTYQAANAARVAFVIQYRLRCADGSYAWVQHEGAPQFDGEGALTGYTNILLDVTEIRQIRNEIQHQQSQLREASDTLARLRNVMSAAARFKGLDETLEFILDQVVHLLHAQAGIIFQFDPQNQFLSPQVSVGLPNAFVKQLSTLYGQGLIGQVAQRRCSLSEPVAWVAHAVDDQNPDESAESRQNTARFIQMFTCAIATPLFAHQNRTDDVIGVLAIYKQASVQFHPEEVAMTVALATQISTVMATAHEPSSK